MSSLTGAGVEVDIQGKKYTLEPLRFEDMEWLELKLKARCIEAARMSVENADEKTRERVLDQAFERADKIDVFGQIRDLFTPLGMSWLLWRMVRRNHPEVTLDVVGEWVRNPATIRDLTPQLTLLVGVKKTPEIPTRKHPVRKRSRRQK